MDWTALSHALTANRAIWRLPRSDPRFRGLPGDSAAFVYVNPTAFNLWALALLFAIYVINTLSWTLLSTILEKRAMQTSGRLTTIEMPPGLIEGAETIAFYTLFYFLPEYSGILFITFGLLVLFTAGQRVWWAARNLQ